MEHIAIPAGERHQPHNFEYANAAVRTAASITDATLIHSLALQLDDGSYWRLTGVAPATWTESGLRGPQGIQGEPGEDGAPGGTPAWGDITGKPTTLAGYGITDAEPIISKAAGYGKWNGSAWVFVNETYMQTSHAANGIAGGDITNWNAAFGWGNHATAGYQTALGFTPENAANKDVSGGYVGLSGWSVKLRNLANSFTSLLQNSATAARIWTMPDKDGTVAMTSEVHDASAKTPVDADELGIMDSAASWVQKKVTLANFKTFLAATFAALGGNTFTGAQIYGDQVLSRGMTKDMGLVFNDKGNSGTSAQTIDYTAGSHQKLTVTGAFVMNAVTNWPPTGNTGELLLELVNGASSAITWTMSGTTQKWWKSDGTSVSSIGSSGVTLQASGTDWILMWSTDAGTTTNFKVMR